MKFFSKAQVPRVLIALSKALQALIPISPQPQRSLNLFGPNALHH